MSKHSALHCNDIERFIFPLVRNLRKNFIPLTNSVTQGRGEAKYFTGDKSPGVKAHVTYFSHRMNTLLNKPLVSGTGGIDVTVPLYRCPFCCDFAIKGNTEKELPWMTPKEITRHISWLHASSGSAQCSFVTFNRLEMERLFLVLPRSTSIKNTVDKDGERKIEREREREGIVLNKARIVVLLDVANIELNAEDILFELLSNDESLLFFSRVACAFVCVHEMFISHTSRPGHIFFQLSRLHPHSDMFTFYAASRNEAGDLLSASLMGELLLKDMRGCGPSVVLLTKDRTQKSCVAELFCGIAGRCGRVFLPRMTTAAILQSLREANNLSMG